MMNGNKEEIKLMYCKNCGGTLTIKDKSFVCNNCNSRFEISDFYGNDEVFMAYIETDESGRRTKDSIIAQEIYYKLNQANISTFFQRISADTFSDDVIESICDVAASNAKIIIIIGTSSEHFKKLFEKYEGILTAKAIIPIFSGMKPSELPQQLASLQGLNYDTVGKFEDLIKVTLHMLNRENETELFHSEKNSHKKKKIWIVGLSLLVVFAALFTYVITSTPFFLKSRKYEYANSLIEKENYIQAIRIFDDIQGYKDSDTISQNLYNSYAGVYKDEDNELTLRLKIIDIYSANIKLIRNLKDGSTSTFNENAKIDRTTISCSYKDNNEVLGKCTIQLENKGINITVFYDNVKCIDTFIPIENKKEDDLFLKADRKSLLSWLDGSTTINNVAGFGYDIEIGGDSEYKLKNNDISIVCNPKGIVESITGLTGVLCPERIGSNAVPYYDGDVLYCPNSGLFWTKSDEERKIVESDKITVASKQSLGENWETLKNDFERTNQSDEENVNFRYLPVGKLKLSMTTREVQRILGEPEGKTQEGGEAATGESVQKWSYSSKGIEIEFVRLGGTEQEVANIRIKKPCDFATPQGIKIGSKRAEVMKVYQNNIDNEMSDNTGNIIVGSIYGGTIFFMDGDSVSEIFVGAAAE